MQSLKLANFSDEMLETTFESPGIGAVLSVLDETSKPSILDLGQMNNKNFAFFSRFDCKLFVEDIAPSLDKINGGADIDECLLNYGEQTKFDAIFAWDIFNYLDLSQLGRLIERIKKNCKPDTLLHVISYTGKSIAESPLHFGLHEGNSLDISHAKLAPRKFPQYSAFELLSHLPQFIAQDTWMARERMIPGVVEYTFRFNPGRHPHEVETRGAAAKHISREFTDTHKTFHKSPGLEQIIGLLDSMDTPPRVLDLGQRINANVDTFKRNNGSVFVENLATSMGGLGQQAIGVSERVNLAPHTIDYDKDQPFDVILVWDIFNYMQPNQVEHLADQLRHYCKKGTKLFVLSYTYNSMPESPRRFTVGDDFYLSYNDTPDNRKSIPCTTTLDLLKRMHGFKIEKTYLMQEGMQSGITELSIVYDGPI